MKKSLKSKWFSLCTLLCFSLILLSVSAVLCIGQSGWNGHYSCGSKIFHSSGVVTGVIGRSGAEENLSEKTTAQNEEESIRPLFRYNRILISAIYTVVLCVLAIKPLSYLPIHTTSCSHLFTIIYLHDTDGSK